MKISNQNLAFVNELAQDPRVMIGWFGNPYTLNQFNTLHQSSDLVIGYQNNPSTQAAMTQLFLGDCGYAGL